VVLELHVHRDGTVRGAIAGDRGYAGAVDPDAADDWTQASWINYAI
jgi:hypothetical protein